MDRHKDIETVEDKMLNTDWPNNVNIGVQYAQIPSGNFERACQISTNARWTVWPHWHGQISQQADQNGLHINFAPYQAEQKAVEFEKAKI